MHTHPSVSGSRFTFSLCGLEPTGVPRFTSSVAPRPTLLERPQAMLTAAVLGAVPDEFGGVAPAVNNPVARVAGLLATAALPALLGAAASESRAGAPVTSFEAEEGEKAEAQTTFGNTTVAACYPTILRPLTCDC